MAAEPERAKVIYVHRNGEPYQDKYGMRMVVHPRKTKNYAQLKNEMTARVRLNTGAVRNVFDAYSGAEVEALEQFEHDKHYVCCSTERVRQISLAKGATPRKSPRPKTALAQPTPSPEKAKVVTVFRNGDRHHDGKKYIISKKRYQTMDQLFEDLSANVGVNTGAVRRLVSTKDIKTDIESIDAIEDKGRYICLGGERGVDLKNLPEKLKQEVKASGTPGSAGKRPGSGKKLEKFGTQTDKGRVIWAYANGDKHHKGTKFVIHKKKFKTMDQLKLTMSNKMGLPTGPVLKVLHYDASLPALVKEVKSLEEFQDEHHYIACGAEKFNKPAMPIKLKEMQAGPPAAEPADDDAFLNPPSATSAAPTSPLAQEQTPADPEPEPEPEPAAEPEPEPATEPEPEPEPEPAAEPEPEPAAEPDPEPAAEPEPEAAAVDEEDEMF